jgi:hypothetical protein
MTIKSMPTKDGFTPDRHFSLFLSGHADEHKRGSSRLLRASILFITATVIGIAITLSLGNPVKVFADVTASLTDILARQPGTHQSTPTIQSTADAQALPPTARGTPPHDEITAAFEPADQNQIEISKRPDQALLKQFQAWAAKEDAQTLVGPVQPVQDALAQVAENARAPVRHLQRHRHIRSLQSARAEIRPAQRHRHVRPVQNARAHHIRVFASEAAADAWFAENDPEGVAFEYEGY